MLYEIKLGISTISSLSDQSINTFKTLGKNKRGDFFEDRFLCLGVPTTTSRWFGDVRRIYDPAVCGYRTRCLGFYA
jgi:hypothetical protein